MEQIRFRKSILAFYKAVVTVYTILTQIHSTPIEIRNLYDNVSIYEHPAFCQTSWFDSIQSVRKKAIIFERMRTKKNGDIIFVKINALEKRSKDELARFEKKLEKWDGITRPKIFIELTELPFYQGVNISNHPIPALSITYSRDLLGANFFECPLPISRRIAVLKTMMENFANLESGVGTLSLILKGVDLDDFVEYYVHLKEMFPIKGMLIRLNLPRKELTKLKAIPPKKEEKKKEQLLLNQKNKKKTGRFEKKKNPPQNKKKEEEEETKQNQLLSMHLEEKFKKRKLDNGYLRMKIENGIEQGQKIDEIKIRERLREKKQEEEIEEARKRLEEEKNKKEEREKRRVITDPKLRYISDVLGDVIQSGLEFQKMVPSIPPEYASMYFADFKKLLTIMKGVDQSILLSRTLNVPCTFSSIKQGVEATHGKRVTIDDLLRINSFYGGAYHLNHAGDEIMVNFNQAFTLGTTLEANEKFLSDRLITFLSAYVNYLCISNKVDETKFLGFVHQLALPASSSSKPNNISNAMSVKSIGMKNVLCALEDICEGRVSIPFEKIDFALLEKPRLPEKKKKVNPIKEFVKRQCMITAKRHEMMEIIEKEYPELDLQGRLNILNKAVFNFDKDEKPHYDEESEKLEKLKKHIEGIYITQSKTCLFGKNVIHFTDSVILTLTQILFGKNKPDREGVMDYAKKLAKREPWRYVAWERGLHRGITIK